MLVYVYMINVLGINHKIMVHTRLKSQPLCGAGVVVHMYIRSWTPQRLMWLQCFRAVNGRQGSWMLWIGGCLTLLHIRFQCTLGKQLLYIILIYVIGIKHTYIYMHVYSTKSTLDST